MAIKKHFILIVIIFMMFIVGCSIAAEKEIGVTQSEAPSNISTQTTLPFRDPCQSNEDKIARYH